MEKYFEKELEGEHFPPFELERPVRSGGALFLRYGVRSCTAGSAVYAEISGQLEESGACRTAVLWDRRTLYLPGDVKILMPGFQEKLTPVPPDAGSLYAALLEYDYLMVRLPRSDVDKGIEFVPDAVRLNGMMMELLTAGKLAVHRRTSDGKVSILRVVPETEAGTARPSS